MKKTAYIFPGQGAQYVGMAKDFYDNFQEAKNVFEEASDALGYSMEKLIFEGPEEKLNLTEYTQPAILTASRAISQVVDTSDAFCTAGLSLGEYSALVFAKSLEFSKALPLVRNRGIYMQAAVPAGVGGMYAILGLEKEQVEEICASVKGNVWPANYNCPGQLVISGEIAALKEAEIKAIELGAKGVIPLPLSAPFHTGMLISASEKLADELAEIEISSPAIDIYFNVTGNKEDNAEKIKDLLKRQVMSPVLWEDSVRKMLADGVERFIEFGPGKALSSFIKKIDNNVEIINIRDLSTLKKAGV